MKSRRSTGTSVALPPMARMASSTSSRPPTVRAAKSTSAPSAAKCRATAAPMPREAPVISAILPARRLVTLSEPSSGFSKKRQLHGDLAVIGVDKRDRVIAGKAGVAEVRSQVVSPGLAHRPVEPVDRQKGEAVDSDQLGHSGDIQVGGEELVTLRRGDPVKTRMARRRARDPHVDLLRPCASDHFHDFDRSGAAHDRVVDEDHALAGKIGPARIVLQTDAEVADLVGRLDERPTDVMIADDAKLERQPRFLGIADRGGDTRIRDRHDDVRIDRAFASEFLSDALARFVNTPALDDTVGAGEVDVLEDAEAAVAA